MSLEIGSLASSILKGSHCHECDILEFDISLWGSEAIGVSFGPITVYMYAYGCEVWCMYEGTACHRPQPV